MGFTLQVWGMNYCLDGGMQWAELAGEGLLHKHSFHFFKSGFCMAKHKSHLCCLPIAPYPGCHPAAHLSPPRETPEAGAEATALSTEARAGERGMADSHSAGEGAREKKAPEMSAADEGRWKI